MNAINPGIAANVRASEFFIAFAVGPCARCAQLMPLIALGAPVGHERLDDGGWLAVSEETLLHDIESLAPEASAVVQALFPQFRPTPAPDQRWLNHCGSCGCAQDDYWLHCEPDAPFQPLSAEAADWIDLIACHMPFAAQAQGMSEGIAHFGAMRRVG